MVAADIHGMETPSPLVTPGYLPLLSEASTPISPGQNLQPNVSISPGTNSPRISFRSFTLPLEFSDDTCSAVEKFEETPELARNTSQSSVRSDNPNTNINTVTIKCNDPEMSCDSFQCGETSGMSYHGVKYGDQTQKEIEEEDVEDQDKSTLTSIGPSITRRNEQSNLPSSSATDLDSPMSCEQTLEDLPDSGFVICDSSDKMFTNTDTQPETNTNNSGEWVMIERTTESVSTLTSDPLEGTVAIATDLPRQLASDNISRTSLDLTMGSTVETDTSCVGGSDLTESPVLQSHEDTYDMTECKEFVCMCQHNEGKEFMESKENAGSHEDEKYGDQKNGNESRYNRHLDNDNVYSNLNDSSANSDKVSLDENNHENGERANGIPQNASIPNFPIVHGMTNPVYLSKLKRNINMSPMQTSEALPSESAAEACDIAHDPEGASEVASGDSSCTFSNASSPIDESVVLRDTAAILQELALQRLSGGVGSETPLQKENLMRKTSFQAEIGKEGVRERRMRYEECSRAGKTEEASSNQYLPPCLRARHARATRAALSRSLDEAKFNRMTDESSRIAQVFDRPDYQHNSTPNVGGNLSMASSQSNEKLQLKNLGLDLGDPRCRERIEKYKEERRIFLRDKYRSESFRGSAARDDNGEQALLARLKQRASRPTLH